MDPDRQADIEALDSTLTTVERVLDVDGLRSRIDKLEREAADPNLWDDQAHAQRVTSELSHTQGELRRVEGLRQRLDDLPVLYELADIVFNPKKTIGRIIRLFKNLPPQPKESSAPAPSATKEQSTSP